MCQSVYSSFISPVYICSMSSVANSTIFFYGSTPNSLIVCFIVSVPICLISFSANLNCVLLYLTTASFALCFKCKSFSCVFIANIHYLLFCYTMGFIANMYQVVFIFSIPNCILVSVPIYIIFCFISPPEPVCI